MNVSQRRHNPERTSWRGKSYKKGGKNIRGLREALVGTLMQQGMWSRSNLPFDGAVKVPTDRW